MKKIIQLVLVCAGIGIMAASTSCSSNYDATPTVPGKDTIKNPLRGDFTAMVDGQSFIANSKYVSDKTENGVRTLTVIGYMDSPNKDPEKYKSIALSITNYNGPGNYPIQLGTAGLYLIVDKTVQTPYLAKAGEEAHTITITSDGDNVEGTFNFIVAPNGIGTADNHTISEGKFNIPK